MLSPNCCLAISNINAALLSSSFVVVFTLCTIDASCLGWLVRGLRVAEYKLS